MGAFATFAILAATGFATHEATTSRKHKTFGGDKPPTLSRDTTSANTVMAAERSERERGGRTRQSSATRRRSATALSGGDTLKLSKPGLLGI